MTRGRVQGLPPGCVLDERGHIIRVLKIEGPDGSSREQRRPVALSLKEAKKYQRDYFDPYLGWIRAGVKAERDHPLEPPELIDLGEDFDESDEDEEE